MTSKLNWTRTRFVGKAHLDFRREHDLLDRDAAAKWLQRAESQRPQWRHPRPRPARSISMSTDWITASSTAEVPW
jgi:hypothetical protein